MAIGSSSVVDVSAWDVVDTEPGGDDPKLWLRSPTDGRRWLYKTTVVHGGREQGEDWAEMFVADVAGQLGVPTATIELGVRDQRHGCLSLDLVADRARWDLQPGAVLLWLQDSRLERKSRSRYGHRLETIRSALDGVAPPPGLGRADGVSAFGVFAGYLVLDALVANRDRHEENWGVLHEAEGDTLLAPSYDHASSLGFGLTDSYRVRCLAGSPGISAWAQRGTANKFEDGMGVTLVAYAVRALAMAGDQARDAWLTRVDALDLARVRQAAATNPRMSEVTRTFCVSLIEENRRRLLDEC